MGGRCTWPMPRRQAPRGALPSCTSPATPSLPAPPKGTSRRTPSSPSTGTAGQRRTVNGWFGRRIPAAAIVRISLVLGFPVTDGNSFIAGLERKLAAGTAVPCPVDEIRTPIDVVTLLPPVLELC